VPSTDAPARSGASVRCAAVGRTYAASRRSAAVVALDDINLDLAPGTITVLIGPSGCGKSTLLRLIAGIDSPTTGSVHIDDDLADDARRAKRFGFVPQAPALLSWRSVRDNVRLLTEVNNGASSKGRATDAEVDELLDAVGLLAFADARPRTLSGGMAQRVALARAFAVRADVLLLDEPFAALDELTRAEMRNLLCRLWRQHSTTVVFSTHDLDEAVLLADRVIVLSGRPGRIVADVAVGLERPTPEGLEETPEFLRALTTVRAALRTTL
jgi:NitT/TauT family transport system ATP-binding protein